MRITTLRVKKITMDVSVNYMYKYLTGIDALLIERTGWHPGSSDALFVHIWMKANIALPY